MSYSVFSELQRHVLPLTRLWLTIGGNTCIWYALYDVPFHFFFHLGEDLASFSSHNKFWSAHSAFGRSNIFLFIVSTPSVRRNLHFSSPTWRPWTILLYVRYLVKGQSVCYTRIKSRSLLSRTSILTTRLPELVQRLE